MNNLVIQDKKREYLIRTFSRTKRKDYENYIINGIWHKLNRLDIKPVTQQYVMRSDGNRALIDLYFPQLNYGIECDEGYHIENYENDKIRELTMEEMLNTIEETGNFILRRVPAYESIELIDSRIKEIATEIIKLFEERNIPAWNMDTESFEIALNKMSISVDDNLEFYKIVDICKCFGKDMKAMQRCFFNIGSGYQIWCPKLAIKTEKGLKAVANGWINELSMDWETISERNETKESIGVIKGEVPRITFAKSKDILGRNVYKFIGVFIFDENKSSKEENIYVRIKKELDLTPWNSK